MKRLIFIVLCYVLLGQGHAQTIPVRRLTTNDGLPSNSVRHIMKDSHGYFWIGTDGGACRYDGRQFVYYNLHDGLPGNRIWSIAEGKGGEMWFGCYNAGIARYDGTGFTVYDTTNGLVNNYVREVVYSASLDAVLIATSKGFSILKDGRFINFDENTPGIVRSPLCTGFLEEDGKIYAFCFGSPSYVIDPSRGYSVQLLEGLIPEEYRSTSSIHRLNGNMLVQGFDRQGIVIYNENRASHYREAGQVFGVAMDEYGQLWVSGWDAGISTGHGLFRLKDGRLESYNNKIGSDSRKGWKLFYDPTNHFLWYATLDEGIYILEPEFFTYYPANWFNLEMMEISDLYIQADSTCWIISNNNVIQRQNDRIRIFTKEEFIRARMHAENGAVSHQKLTTDFVRFSNVEPDNYHDIYVSTSIGLFRYDDQSRSFVFVSSGANEHFVFDEKDTMVVGNYWSTDFSQLVHDGEKWVHHRAYSYENAGGSQNIVKLVQHGNETWIASMTVGLVLNCNGRNTAFNILYPEIDNYITDIAVGPDGLVYAGGSSGSVYEFHKIKDEYRLLRTLNPPNDHYGTSVMWLIFDRKGNLFIGMNNGLNVIPAKDLSHGLSPKRKFFGTEEGYFSSLSVNPALGPDGRIWVGSGNGLLCIDPDKLVFYELTNPVPRISSLTVIDTRLNDEVVYTRELLNGTKTGLLDMEYYQNQVNFEYRLLDFFGDNKVWYEIVLDNGVRTWRKESFDNSILYPALEPANYNLAISAYHMTTGQIFGPEKISFTINKPWWRNAYFIISMAIVLAMLVWLLAWWRIRMIRMKELERVEVSRQMADLEIKALQAQINPHFIFNAITGIQSFILKKDEKTALKYLGDLSFVLRQTLEKSFQQLVSIEEEVNYIKRYLQLEQMRYKDLISFNIMIDPELNLHTAVIPPMILQPLVENAIRHGILPRMKLGHIQISILKKDRNTILCIVEDDGIGRKKARELSIKKNRKHRSFGLEITKKRLDVIGKSSQKGTYSMEIVDLEDEHGNGTGTRVIIHLPLRAENVKEK